jgi:hypothetical protein
MLSYSSNRTILSQKKAACVTKEVATKSFHRVRDIKSPASADNCFGEFISDGIIPGKKKEPVGSSFSTRV